MSCRRIVIALLAALGAAAASAGCGGGQPGRSPEAIARGEAQAREALARYQRGDFGGAATAYDAAASSFKVAGRKREQVDCLIASAAACQMLGRYEPAEASLATAIELARDLGDRERHQAAASALGSVWTFSGGDERKIDIKQRDPEAQLLRALALCDEAAQPGAAARTRTNLANFYASRRRFSAATGEYVKAHDLALRGGDGVLAARSSLNAAAAAAAGAGTGGDVPAAAKLNTDGLAELAPLPDDHQKVRLMITAAVTDQHLMQLSPDLRPTLARRSRETLERARALAASAGDSRLESYALGYLGRLSELKENYQGALDLTRDAIFHAQLVGSKHALYRWHWQSARLHTKLGNRDVAEEMYRVAVETIKPVRPGLAFNPAGDDFTGASPAEADGRPALYLELVDLLFRRADHVWSPDQLQDLLLEARDALELRKVAEIENYFQEPCVKRQRERSQDLVGISKNSAAIYIVPLPDRTELLVGTLVNDRPQWERVTCPVNSVQLSAETETFRRLLETRTTRRFMTSARRLYDWLIAPIDQRLTKAGITTLVLVPDGPLLGVPLAALHDGKGFLIERYAFAVSPGRDLIDPMPIDWTRARLLVAGLSEPREQFPALEYVPEEVAALSSMLPGLRLSDDKFTSKALGSALDKSPFTVVHLASHGEFGSDVGKTRILTHTDDLTPKTLQKMLLPYQFRERPVELLTLSACETAAGEDYRSALGLAGIGIRCGVRSSVATLWSVNDSASARLMSTFYASLKSPGGRPLSKAEALQKAQLDLLHDPRYRHPCYWSAFLVIGNWL